ncbi:DUF7528 family protein [Halorubellus litoreus]|uniref:Uncharacterized protein n=1 Tax=Halorubellus litoreus TaxID=755308 RepID=A0ABD5VDT6_9EURY
MSNALTRTTEYVHTTGTHREDDAYVVARRGADSAGHEKVFESFEACRGVYDELPESFTASDVERSGLTGGRRHMLVWHYAEHPAFDCELASRQPLTVEKTVEGEAVDEEATDDERAADATASANESTTGDHLGVMPADD